MIMGSHSNGYSQARDEFNKNDGVGYLGFDQEPVFENDFMFKDSNLDINFLGSPSTLFGSDTLDLTTTAINFEVDSPTDREESDNVFKFISEMLMDEELVEKSGGLPDPLALQAAEKSFYDVIGETYIPNNSDIESPNGSSTDSKCTNSSNSSVGPHASDTSNNSYTTSGSSVEHGTQPFDSRSKSSNSSSSSVDFGQQQRNSSDKRISSSNGSVGPPLYVSETAVLQNSLQPVRSIPELAMPSPVNFWNGPGDNFNGMLDSSHVSSFFSDNDSVLQFKKGMEEASKFLPPEVSLKTDLENPKLPPQQSNSGVSEVIVEVEKEERGHSTNSSRGKKNHHREEKDERGHSANSSRGKKNHHREEKDERGHSTNSPRGKKNHHREDIDTEEERSAKQSAVYVEEDELVEMFDQVLLCSSGCAPEDAQQSRGGNLLQQNGKPNETEGGKSRSRRRGNKSDVVDLRTLLILCAQAVNGNDRRGADDLLKQIRQHSSPIGDGNQRVAHYFANALEARMAGTGNQIYASLASKTLSAAAKLKVYQVYLSACPFKKVAMHFANSHIFKLAEKAKTIHIIDFGIMYGFQWPMFFQCLPYQTSPTPRIRLTGIELPQPGFRPADRVEETGRRLRSYCERFNIPFEFIPVVQKWENIQIEDLKIQKNEAIAVNCLYRFDNLLDETVVVNSPRDAVLNLVGKIKPDVFTLSVTNGSYGAPFFITRFREALFHYSAVFDMLDSNMTRVNPERLLFEKSYYGREIMNVVACEGLERDVRPETYKQWQVRIARARFRQLHVDTELLSKMRDKMKSGYHKDFSVDEDSDWILQGWKGRIINGASCWVPDQESS